ncbi:MAG: LLM class flavin-dependent oxidoreductase [Pseudonocardiaceae bacterium]|jgi:alkanesulfonate monooxygenase SsuD/methylene tetrahydromethanopterin reductase-like flavin-dependent oxidoreductase (luciferase family)|nr:LLM class flavin-dependent oxidoreductase [Pseudonocardiaceae bacterium]
MRFGVFLLAAQFPGQDHTTVLESTVAAAVAAEEAGFDDVWVAEHHFMSYGICPSAITLAGYLLGATRRVAVGTAVSVLSTQHPVALAEQAVLLDQVSGGRLRLGVGRGGPWIDLEVFGTGLHRYQHGFPESLDLLLAALTGPRLAASGAHFRFSDVDIVPRPRTPPHPEVILAATTAATVELAAQRGLPLLLGMHASDADKAALIDHYNQVATRPLGHLAAALAYVADSQHEAMATMRTCLPRWLGPGLAGYRRADGAPHHPRDPTEYTELLCRLHPVGTPEHCLDKLRTTAQRTGIGHLILLVEGTGDRARTLENITRLGAEVLPSLRDRTQPQPVRHSRSVH